MEKEIIAFDESGTITRHYEDCEQCGSKGALKVYECIFSTWRQVEKSCSACLYLERKIYPNPDGRSDTS
ncbi:MAG: hypothetical protein HPY50_03870 [Firmicutes bacterium]|nr:hypothetical protein [Bacillota bacterium]